ncbi:MAG: hypothetical protein FJX76_26130, partial [Armatimonadetes bacterium]|nr:hypothetical protein [Armatimonadota bacterium]
MTPATPLRDPREAQNRLQADNQAFFKEVDRVAFEGNGDASYWMNRAEYMAFRAQAYAARSTLTVAAQREDAPNVRLENISRMSRLDSDMHRTANHWADGYGDSRYWFSRCKGLSIQSAQHAAAVAALCDSSMAAAVQGTIARGLSVAEDAHSGSGDAHYWSARTGSLAQDLRGSLGQLGSALSSARTDAQQQPATTAEASDLQRGLENLNARFSKEVDNIVFGKSGDATDWMYRAQHLAMRGTVHAARKSMLLAEQRKDTAADRDAAVAAIADTVKNFAEDADRFAAGSGNAGYWCGRTVAFSVRVAEFVNAVAAKCDAPTMQAVKPALEDILSRAEDAAFNGSGYAEYWMNRLGDAAHELKFSFQSARIGAQAEAAAARVEPPQGAEQPEERTSLEGEIARDTVLRDEWQKILGNRDAMVASYQGELSTLAAKINPLAERDGKILKGLNIAKLTFGAGILGTLGGLGFANSLGTAGAVLLEVGGALLAGGLCGKIILGGKHAKIMDEYRPLDA